MPTNPRDNYRGYYRIDVAHLQNNANGEVEDRKRELDSGFNKVGGPAHKTNIRDEDDAHDGTKILWHKRKVLNDLLEYTITYDPLPAPPIKLPDKDKVLYIGNLSHLSAEPAVIGRIVRIILNNTSFDLFVMSVKMDSRISEHAEFFNGIKEWAKITCKPDKPAMIRSKVKTTKEKISTDGGGGDGGGNGGC